MEAVIVQNAYQALDVLQCSDFDLILMDLKLPGMNGLECTKRIRELEQHTGTHIPIIAATACAYPVDKANCLEAGMDDYLAKPFTLNELETKLAKWSVVRHRRSEVA
jgi:CheY-like chemotaxis protein